MPWTASGLMNFLWHHVQNIGHDVRVVSDDYAVPTDIEVSTLLDEVIINVKPPDEGDEYAD